MQKLEVGLAKERTRKDTQPAKPSTQNKGEEEKQGLEQSIRQAEKKRLADQSPLVQERQELLRAKRKQLEEARKAYAQAAQYAVHDFS